MSDADDTADDETAGDNTTNATDDGRVSRVAKPDTEWREELSDEQYRILREEGTEARFSGEYVDHDGEGIYRCTACGTVLFDSGTKYESGCGWPAFYAAEEESITTQVDNSHGMRRIEVRCAGCDGHLGHVFEDGPDPTGKRFCINSVALEFDPAE